MTPEDTELDGPPEPARILSFSDYLALNHRTETWLIEPLLPSGGSLLLYGDPKVGKSFAALQLAEALATGGHWLNFSSSKPCKTVYCQLDTPGSLWADRIQSLHKSGMVGLEKVLWADRQSLGCWPFSILNPDHQVTLAHSLQDINADVVIMDTLRECCSGADENDATAMQEAIAYLTEAVSPSALVVVHHGKKPNPEFPSSVVTGARGSNYITGKMDGLVQFHKGGANITGRAVEEVELALERVPRGQPLGGTWKMSDKEEARKQAQILLADDETFPTLRAKARELANRTGKTPEAALSMLARMAE